VFTHPHILCRSKFWILMLYIHFIFSIKYLLRFPHGYLFPIHFTRSYHVELSSFDNKSIADFQSKLFNSPPLIILDELEYFIPVFCYQRYLLNIYSLSSLKAWHSIPYPCRSVLFFILDSSLKYSYRSAILFPLDFNYISTYVNLFRINDYKVVFFI